MTFFEILIVSHFVADWLFQTDYEAIHKAQGSFLNKAILKHCSVYTLCFVGAIYFWNVSFWFLPAIFITHLVIDRRWPVAWWITKIKRTGSQFLKENFWFFVIIDQVFHIVILAIIAIIAKGAV
jgi:hypothetical protein